MVYPNKNLGLKNEKIEKIYENLELELKIKNDLEHQVQHRCYCHHRPKH